MSDGLTRRTVLTISSGLLAANAGCLDRAGSAARPTARDETPSGGGRKTEHDLGETEPTETTAESDPEPPENGAVAFVYDDGPMTDYTKALPVHREFDAPATTCPVVEWIGTGAGVAERLDVHHLRELVDAGWEVASHTMQHTTLGEFAFTEDAAPGDSRIYPEEIRHGHHEGLDVEITDGERSVTRTVAGLGRDEDDVRYVELEESLGEHFEAGTTVVRYPADRMEEALGESERRLELHGFEVDTLLAPYDNFGDYAMEFVPEYYDRVANARPVSRINDPVDFDPYWTKRDYFSEFTDREAVQRDLDEIAETGALGVFGTHSWKESVTQDRIRETLQWIDERGIAVLTLREACKRFAG